MSANKSSYRLCVTWALVTLYSLSKKKKKDVGKQNCPKRCKIHGKPFWQLHGAGGKSVLLSHLLRQILQGKKRRNLLLPTHSSLHNKLFTLHRLIMGVLLHAGLSQFCPEAKQDMKDSTPLPFPRSNLLCILQPVY